MKQMGRTLLMMFFFLFYGAMMAQTFGIVWTDTLALVLGAAVTLFSVQVLSLLLYNFTNGNPARVRTAKAILYVYLAAIAGIILLEFTEGGSNMEALLAAVSSQAGIPAPARLDQGRMLCVHRREPGAGGPVCRPDGAGGRRVRAGVCARQCRLF